MQNRLKRIAMVQIMEMSKIHTQRSNHTKYQGILHATLISSKKSLMPACHFPLFLLRVCSTLFHPYSASLKCSTDNNKSIGERKNTGHIVNVIRQRGYSTATDSKGYVLYMKKNHATPLNLCLDLVSYNPKDKHSVFKMKESYSCN